MSALKMWQDQRFPRSIFEDVTEMLQDFDRHFGSLSQNRDQTEGFNPSCDLTESSTGLNIVFEVPGIDKRDIDIEIVGNVLKVSGEKRQENSVGKDGSFRRERVYGKFQRSFTVPDTFNTDEIQAEFDNGLLKLQIPRAPGQVSRKIEIADKAKGLLGKLRGKSDPKVENE